MTLNQNLSRLSCDTPTEHETPGGHTSALVENPGIGLRSVDGSNIAENSQGIRADKNMKLWFFRYLYVAMFQVHSSEIAIITI